MSVVKFPVPQEPRKNLHWSIYNGKICFHRKSGLYLAVMLLSGFLSAFNLVIAIMYPGVLSIPLCAIAVFLIFQTRHAYKIYTWGIDPIDPNSDWGATLLSVYPDLQMDLIKDQVSRGR